MRKGWIAFATGGALLLAAAGTHGAPPDTLHRKTGKTIFIGSEAPASAFGMSAGIAGEIPTPQAYLKAYGPAFGLADPADAKVTRDRRDERGGRSTRFRQHHRGVPVFAGEVIVNLDAAGAMKAMAGRLAPDLDVDTVPTLGADDAARIALEATAKWHRASPGDLDATIPELHVYDPRRR